MNDHIDASRKFRNCSPTLSENPIKDPDEQLKRFKLEVKQAYDTLDTDGWKIDSSDPTNIALNESPYRWRNLVPIC